MLKEFEADKSYKFSAERFKEAEGEDSLKESENWIKYCEGQKLEIIDRKNAKCKFFLICPLWCEEVKEKI